MRVLFTSIPAAGHFQPLLPLARALAAGGHVVAFASGASLRPQIEAAGFQAFAAGRWITENPEKLRAVIGSTDDVSMEEIAVKLSLDVMSSRNPRHAVPDLIEICREWKPDVVVREQAELGGAIAAEHLGLVHAAVQVLFFYGRSELDGPISKRLDRIRHEWGLPPDPHLDMHYRYLFLSFTPPSFLRSRENIPSTMHFLRRTECEGGTESAGDLPAELPLRRPVIYATLGTNMSRLRSVAPNRAPDLIPTLIASLAPVARTLLVTVGRDRDLMELGGQPPHVHIAQYIPQHLILPYCDLVVTHGGHNTVIPALGQGIPLVLIPFWSDQPYNARRCEELGVGRVIEPLDVTPMRLQSVAQEVLQNPAYRQRAQEIREEMEALPPLEQGVALLEELVQTGAPIIA